MKTSEKGIALINEFEGCRLAAYQDSVGVWTVGFGHTKTAVNGMRITQCEADRLLAADVAEHEVFIRKYVTAPINQNQFDALSSFVFNLGGGSLKSSTLLKKLNARDYKGAAAEFDRWCFAGGVKLAGLVRRRKAERELFESLS